MAIVLLLLAVLVSVVALRHPRPGMRKLLLLLGIVAAGVALALALLQPALAWNLRMVGHVVMRLVGPLLHHIGH